jgi:hypothetical protein
MKASRAFRLIVTRAGHVPAFLADPSRTDHVEVVEIDSGEVVLYWDLPPREASRRARALNEDLDRLQADEFLERWSA